MRLVDDQELARWLRSPTRNNNDDIYTTGLWYLRLCQAALGSRNRGVLSGPFLQLPAAQRRKALQSVIALPSSVGLVSMRDLAPTMGQLQSETRLNLLASEALAAALHLDATVCLSAPSPRLEQALIDRGCEVQRLYEN